MGLIITALVAFAGLFVAIQRSGSGSSSSSSEGGGSGHPRIGIKEILKRQEEEEKLKFQEQLQTKAQTGQDKKEPWKHIKNPWIRTRSEEMCSGNWTNAYAERHRYIRKLTQQRLANGGPVHEDERYMVFHVDGLAGGWGDRIHGLLTVFSVALITDSAFVVSWPFLNGVLDPVNVDWTLAEGLPTPLERIGTVDQHQPALRGHPWKTLDVKEYLFGKGAKTIRWSSNNWYEEEGYCSNPKYAPWCQRNFANIYTEDPVGRRQWTQKMFGCFYNYLFKPKERLQNIIDSYVEQFQNKFVITMQLRMGGAMVPWGDPVRNWPENIPVIFECIRKLVYEANATFARDQQPPKNWDDVTFFLTTDSDQLKKDLKAKFGDRLITPELTIGHIYRDRPSAKPYDAIVVEGWLLVEGDFFLSSRSNLGWAGGRRGMVPFGTFDVGRCHYDFGIHRFPPKFHLQVIR